jgi:hypothetical protein
MLRAGIPASRIDIRSVAGRGFVRWGGEFVQFGCGRHPTSPVPNVEYPNDPGRKVNHIENLVRSILTAVE